MVTRYPRRVASTSRTLGALALISCALPVNLAVTAGALLASAIRGRRPVEHPTNPHTVLVSGGKMTKALHLCRAFHRAGHRVVLVESAKYRLTGHRFSNCVDAFHVVPTPAEPGYARALLDIVHAEGVDVYVPVCSPVASYHDACAADLLAPYCEVLHASADEVRMLDDKYEFARTASSLGLAVPDTHRVRSADDVEAFDFDAHDGAYVLKNLAYDPVNRLDLTQLPLGSPEWTASFARSKPISPDSPWILQSFLPGREYCTHGTVRDGRLVAYVCCESSAFQLNYDPVDQPDIEKWVRGFVEPLGLTGQVSFDVMAGPDGTVRAIECNPRTHSAITVFDDPVALAAAYLDELPADQAPLRPRPGARPTYWLYQELWRMLRHPAHAGRSVRVIAAGRDAVFDRDDPLPFLLLHHLQIPALLITSLVHGKAWVRIDVNIGKLIEPGGD